MKLEKIVANKDLSEELWRLGVRVDSLFKCEKELDKDEWYIVWSDNSNPERQSFSALTASELGEILPSKIEKLKWGSMNTDFEDRDKRWGCALFGLDWKEPFLYAETEADARAKMLQYLLKQGLVKVEDVKL